LLDTILVLKLAIAPALILCASYAGKRWGHAVSGWLVSLPISSAPVIFLLALERGGDFASTSAEGAILGFASLSAFSLVYSLLSLRLQFSWLPSIIIGWCVFFLFAFILQSVEVSLFMAFICVVGWLLLVVRLLPKSDFSEEVASGGYTKWTILARMIAAVSLIFLITEYAPLLGPRLSGLLAPFPIYTSVITLSIHRRQGAASSVEFVRGGTVGLFTSTVFFLIVGSLIVGWGIGASYALAITASLIVHGFLLKLLRRHS
jgi:hypothetical protein